MRMVFGTALVMGVMAAAIPPAPAGGPARIQDLSWMSGTWRGDDRGIATEEAWTTPDGGLMLALHKDVKGGRVTDWEFLRIEERPEGLVLLASPKGAPATPFPLLALEGERVLFANPGHDYPKRIHYWRTPDGALHAAIDGGEGTERLEWRWTRAR